MNTVLSKKWMVYAAVIVIVIVVCIFFVSSTSHEYELQSVRVYDILGDELKGATSGFKGSITSDTSSIHDGTKLILSYQGREYSGQVHESYVFWERINYGNILGGARDGYTTISYGKKSVVIKLICNYPLDNGTETYITVVMSFERK